MMQAPQDMQMQPTGGNWQEEDPNEQVTINAVVQLVRDDRMRGFHIDVQTDQLIDADDQAEKQRAIEFVQAVGQFLGQFGPMVKEMPPLAPLAGEMLKFAVRRFHTGRELEEVIERSMDQITQLLMNPPPPQPSPDEMVKLEGVKVKAAAEGRKAEMDAQSSAVQHQQGLQRMALEAESNQAEHAMKMDQMAMQGQLAREKAEHARANQSKGDN